MFSKTSKNFKKTFSPLDIVKIDSVALPMALYKYVYDMI